MIANEKFFFAYLTISNQHQILHYFGVQIVLHQIGSTLFVTLNLLFEYFNVISWCKTSIKYHVNLCYFYHKFQLDEHDFDASIQDAMQRVEIITDENY